LRFTSPQAPSVLPMFLMTVLNTVFRSCLSTPCSWYAWRVVRRSVPLPYYRTNTCKHKQEQVNKRPAVCVQLLCCW
jgi:hypothetical protein